jgi:hypothetical protein
VRRLVHAAVVDASIGVLDCGGLDGCVVRPTVDVAQLAEQNPVGRRHIVASHRRVRRRPGLARPAKLWLWCASFRFLSVELSSTVPYCAFIARRQLRPGKNRALTAVMLVRDTGIEPVFLSRLAKISEREQALAVRGATRRRKRGTPTLPASRSAGPDGAIRTYEANVGPTPVEDD